MTKRLTLICFLLFCFTGIKAQTYCYQLYKYYDFQDIPYDVTDKGYYNYYTFKDDLLFRSEKDGSLHYESYVPGYKSYSPIFKLFDKKDGTLKYVEIDENGAWLFEKRFWLVSKDKEYMNVVYPYDQPQPDYIKVVKQLNTHFEKVTCYKKHSSVDNGAYKVPAMKY